MFSRRPSPSVTTSSPASACSFTAQRMTASASSRESTGFRNVSPGGCGRGKLPVTVVRKGLLAIRTPDAGDVGANALLHRSQGEVQLIPNAAIVHPIDEGRERGLVVEADLRLGEDPPDQGGQLVGPDRVPAAVVDAMREGRLDTEAVDLLRQVLDIDAAVP